MTPTVSVLMPVFNAERFVAEAVESILGQTLSDLELIIIDDGSTDGSLAVLRRLADRDGRIRVVSRPNRGISPTRNEALEMARGEFIAVMDADDVALPSKLEVQVRHLRHDPQCLAVGCMAETIDEDGELLGRWVLPTSHEDIDAQHLVVKQSIIHTSLVAHLEAVRAAGGYRGEMAEDLDLFLRMAEAGRLANVPETLLRVRRHGTSVSHTRTERLEVISWRVVSEARQRRGLAELPQEPRARPTPHSASANHRVWSWLALESGNVPTARKHAFASLRHQPFAFESWRVLYCALRGH